MRRNLWLEVYRSYNAEEFYRIKGGFDKSGIKFKTKINNPMRKRMLFDIILGGRPEVLNTVGMRESALIEYRILVEKAFEQQAYKIISDFRQ